MSNAKIRHRRRRRGHGQVPVLFLDVDGVLNSWDQLAESKNLRGMAPKHVAELARVLRDTGSLIVVSSVWRYELTNNGDSRPGTRFYDELAEKGADGALVLSRIIGRTKELWGDAPDRRNVRGFEIQTWREEHRHTGPFAIVDDDSDMGPLKPHLVKTDNRTGLTRREGDALIRMLEKRQFADPAKRPKFEKVNAELERGF